MLPEVPVIVLDHLSETQKRAYILADNQLALNAGWDDDLLRLELAALQEEDFNVDLIGFEDEELRCILAAQDAAEGLTDEDEPPTVTQFAYPVSPRKLSALCPPFRAILRSPRASKNSHKRRETVLCRRILRLRF